MKNVFDPIKSPIMNRVILLITIVQLLFISEIFSQQQISFNHLTVEDGLSQSSVTCIFQDKKGFMWFGTQDGLNRFDGYNFKVFKNDPTDSTSLSENFIFSIYEDSSGQLYVETRDGNRHLFIAALECFRLVSKENINLANVKMSTVSAQLHEAKWYYLDRWSWQRKRFEKDG